MIAENVQPTIGSFDMWARPPAPETTPYGVDDFGVTYGEGLWPFRMGKDGAGSIRFAPTSEYRAWRNEYIMATPEGDGRVHLSMHLWVREQGLGGMVLDVFPTVDLATGTIHWHPAVPESLLPQAIGKVTRFLACIEQARAERDAGAKRPKTAADLAAEREKEAK